MSRALHSAHLALSSRYISSSYVCGQNCAVIVIKCEPHAGHAHVGMPLKSPISALGAESEYFGAMPYFSKSMFFGHHLGPFFNGATFDFNSIATALADEMMMMGFTA